MEDLKAKTHNQDRNQQKATTAGISNNYHYTCQSFINENWLNTIVIKDEVESFKIVYKGVTYKFNLQKALNLLADALESIEIINNKE